MNPDLPTPSFPSEPAPTWYRFDQDQTQPDGLKGPAVSLYVEARGSVRASNRAHLIVGDEAWKDSYETKNKFGVMNSIERWEVVTPRSLKFADEAACKEDLLGREDLEQIKAAAREADINVVGLYPMEGTPYFFAPGAEKTEGDDTPQDLPNGAYMTAEEIQDVISSSARRGLRALIQSALPPWVGDDEKRQELLDIVEETIRDICALTGEDPEPLMESMESLRENAVAMVPAGIMETEDGEQILIYAVFASQEQAQEFIVRLQQAAIEKAEGDRQAIAEAMGAEIDADSGPSGKVDDLEELFNYNGDGPGTRETRGAEGGLFDNLRVTRN